MSAVDHEAAVAKLLADLGGTADAVADRLRALDIKGIQGVPACCPIARYLQANGLDARYVSAMRIRIGTDYGREYEYDAAGVSDFVSYFDDGVYLDLVEVTQ